MSPTSFLAAMLRALIPIVGGVRVEVFWVHTTRPVRLWTGPRRWLGPRWELQVLVKDGDRWLFWSPTWHLTETLFAVAPPSLPAEYADYFERAWRAGELPALEPFVEAAVSVPGGGGG